MLKMRHIRLKTCAEPIHEDGGYHWSNKVSFGNTDVNDRSYSGQGRNSQKLEMLEKNKGGAMDIVSDDELRSTGTEKRVLVSDSTDDEEMAEWFGVRKQETQRLP